MTKSKAAVLDHEQADKRPERIGQDLAEREVADARAVPLPRDDAGDDGAGGHVSGGEDRAVDKADGYEEGDARGGEVRQREGQAENESPKEHPSLAHAVDPLAAEWAGEDRAEDEDAGGEAGQAGGGAEGIGGVFRDDRHQHEEIHGDQEVLEGDHKEVPGP